MNAPWMMVAALEAASRKDDNRDSGWEIGPMGCGLVFLLGGCFFCFVLFLLIDSSCAHYEQREVKAIVTHLEPRGQMEMVTFTDESGKEWFQKNRAGFKLKQAVTLTLTHKVSWVEDITNVKSVSKR